MELKSCKKKKRKRGGKVQRGGKCRAEGCCSMSRSPRSKNCWSLVLLSACPSSFKTNEEPRHAVGEETEETARRFLSAQANRQAVPLPASPSVAVMLRVSTVSHNSVVDQWRIVEALPVELGSVLKRDGDEEKTEGKGSKL